MNFYLRRYELPQILISRRYERGPMILTNDQSFAVLGDEFGDRIIVTAIFDRLLHHAVTLNNWKKKFAPDRSMGR